MPCSVAIVGGGLSGCEAAGSLSRAGGFETTLFEQRPLAETPAHRTDLLGELVCSNSLKSDRTDRPQGWLKAELRLLGSLVMKSADAAAIPGGEALVVDRAAFARNVTAAVEALPGVTVARREITDIDLLLSEHDFVILASGPLTSAALAGSLESVLGESGLHFYDAISPIVAASSIDMTRAFRASRYGRGGDDYINCPMDRETYLAFREAIIRSEKVEPRGFESARYFEACLPVETVAERGEMSMAYGPLSPAGLTDPKTGKRPFCALQLRMENAEGTAYSLVAFQTRMKYGEQERVIRMVPALAKAEFLRYGSVHRNSFVDSPRHLGPDLSLRNRPRVFIAGVLCGVEGYCESAASGIMAGLSVTARSRGTEFIPPPPTTCLGALHRHVTGKLYGSSKGRFQPMNMHRGLLPEFQVRVPKAVEPELLHKRSIADLRGWLESVLHER
jgi:methylenetetrahydrofolate--tRNA-(uracil-5-)-methyltransferase